MYILRVIPLTTLMVSPLFGRQAQTRPTVPAELISVVDSTMHAVQPDGAGFKASNPTHNLELRFQPTMPSVRLSSSEVRLRLAGFGRGARLQQPASPVIAAVGNRVEYHRGPLTEWYINEKRGLEQGFTFEARPQGEGILQVSLTVDGSLPRMEGPNAAVLERNGIAVLRYSGLEAWDATGRRLKAQLGVAGLKIRLSVDDTGASYPVTVDPWLQQAKLTAPPAGPCDSDCLSAAIDGDTAVVGVKGLAAAYVYVRTGTTWTEQAKLLCPDGASVGGFGESVAISGNTVIVSADGYPNLIGAAYVFVGSGAEWTGQSKLTASDGSFHAGFAHQVSISGDAAIVGTRGYGAYVFARTGSLWGQEKKLISSDYSKGDEFGASVAIGKDTAIVGADHYKTGQGAAYIYFRSSSGWTEQATLTATDGAAGDQFGQTVAIDGDTAIVGAGGYANFSGAAYVYLRSGTVWTQQAKVTASDSASNDYFGSSVALSGNLALIGAHGKVLGTGAAYVYSRGGAVWTEQQKLTASDGVQRDRLGTTVALSGEVGLAGAYLSQSNAASAYVFDSLQTTSSLQLHPGGAYPGVHITVMGSGWAGGEPGETVTVYSYGTRTVLTTLSVDRTGNAYGEWRVPSVPNGRYDLIAIGDSGTTATASFSVRPRVVLQPNAGTAGGNATALGVAFGAGEAVGVYWNSPRVFLGTAKADSTGSFPPFTFTIPANASPGDNIVIGKGLSTVAVGGGHIKIQ